MDVDLLKNFLNKFPCAWNVPAKITKMDRDPKVAEREKLLNESLFEHRRALKRQAMDLLGAKNFKKAEQDYLFTLTSGEREILLQILNDIRVGCWVSLGKPESLDLPTATHSALEVEHHSLMNLASYFEHPLIEKAYINIRR